MGAGDKLWHVVQVSFHDKAPESVRQEAYARYQTLAKDCGGRDTGILFFKVGWNLDTRKDVHLLEVAVFEDSVALQVFRNHPKHKQLSTLLSAWADWWPSNFFAPLPTL